MLACSVANLFFALLFGHAQGQDSANTSHSQLKSLAQFRQEHRRTVDGRLCAAAFVQDKKVHTGCTSAPSPEGDSGRDWCYVEAQLLAGREASWGHCAPVPDYVQMREEAKQAMESDVSAVKAYTARLHKAERAATMALQQFKTSCALA